MKGPGAEVSRRVQSLQSISRAQAHSFSAGSSIFFPGSTKIDEQSLIDMQEVWRCDIFGPLLVSTKFIVKLSTVLGIF